MGWFDYHLWEFTIAKQRYGLPMDEGFSRFRFAIEPSQSLSGSPSGSSERLKRLKKSLGEPNRRWRSYLAPKFVQCQRSVYNFHILRRKVTTT
jgi:hypothetical protein